MNYVSIIRVFFSGLMRVLQFAFDAAKVPIANLTIVKYDIDIQNCLRDNGY